MKRSEKPAQAPKKKVLIVDDHPIVRQGLSMIINQEPDLMVCGEADDAHQALEMILKLKPDIALIDLSLKDTSGLDLIKDIRIRHRALPCLVLSMHDESIYAERALRAGARGYVTKQQAVASIATAIRRVLSGEIHLSDHMVSRILHKVSDGDDRKSALSAVDRLSDRELEVMRLIGQGFETREIADKLRLSAKTIETYKAHLKEKLSLASATELSRFAIEWARSERT